MLHLYHFGCCYCIHIMLLTVFLCCTRMAYYVDFERLFIYLFFFVFGFGFLFYQAFLVEFVAEELYFTSTLEQISSYSLHLLCKPATGCTHTHAHTRLTALCSGLPGWASTRKVRPIWILLKQETVSGSGISWDICKCAPRSRQITMPAPHHSDFYKPYALPAAQPTASKHWRDSHWLH